MALISCEKCGGKVSDSADVCPHCGFDFSEKRLKQEGEKEYTRLPECEQANLRKEYDAVCSEYAQAEKKERSRNRLLIAFGGVCFLGIGGVMIFSRLYYSDKKGPWVLLFILSCLVFVVGFIGSWVEVLLEKKIKRELMRQLKKFQAWLKNEKQLTYHIVLTQKERVIFEDINIGN